MYISVTDKISKPGLRYLIAATIIAAASAVYGLFSHGVHSLFMTYAFMIPLLGGAFPHMTAAFIKRNEEAAEPLDGGKLQTGTNDWQESASVREVHLAVIATLTAGSLLKGALDIYGTTNRLLIVYPIAAGALLTLCIIRMTNNKKPENDQTAGSL